MNQSHTELAAKSREWADIMDRNNYWSLAEHLRKSAAALESPEREVRDCAGGSPCTDCPDKKQCQRGCLRQPEFVSQKPPAQDDCDTVDKLLRGLGLDPERCRTEGGALNVGRALSLLQDGCTTPPTAPAQDAQGVRLQWVLNGDKQCGYNNWLAETAFGRILITWKGWKEDWNMGLSVDEFPGEIPVLHGSPDEVKDAAEQEFFRRVRAATPSPQAEKQPLSDQQIEVLRFLDGVGNLSGFGFGEKPPTERGNYWWRKNLRAAFPDVDFGIVTKEST